MTMQQVTMSEYLKLGTVVFPIAVAACVKNACIGGAADARKANAMTIRGERRAL